MNREIEIVGAGPAGLVAAINLAKAGCNVTVYEEKPDVGLFIFFILSFLTPLKKREWRSMGVTVAFFVALFTEMSKA